MNTFKLIILIILYFSHHVYPANQTSNIDSLSAITIVDQWLPSTNLNAARGFVEIRKGIYLQSITRANIGITNDVKIVISLNGGILQLDEDLLFNGTSFGITSGVISTTDQDQSLIFFQNQTIAFGSNVTCSGNLTIDGQGNSIDLSPSSSFGVRAANKLILKNTALLNVSSTKLIMESTLSKLILQNTDLVLNGDYTFSQGSMEIRGACSIRTTSSLDTTFTYSGHYLFIEKNSSLKIGPNVTFQYNPTSGGREAIRFADQTSELNLNNARLKNNNPIGMIMHNGTLIIDGTSTVEGTSTDTKQALILGGSADHYGDCRLRINPYARLIVKQSGISYRNKGASSFNSSGDLGILELSSNGHFSIEKSITALSDLRLSSTENNTFIGSSSINLNSKTMNFNFDTLSMANGVGDIDPAGTAALISTFNQSGFFVHSCNFSNNGKYLAIGIRSQGISMTYPDSYLQIYSCASNGTLTLVAQDSPGSVGESPSIQEEVFGAAFSSDGKYLARTNHYSFGIYNFDTNNGPSSSNLDPILTIPVPVSGQCLATKWSPDGRFLALSTYGDSNISIYKWNGTGLIFATSSPATTNTNFDVAWSQDGKNIFYGGPTIHHFEFINEKFLVQRKSYAITSPVNSLNTIHMSPDNHYLLIGKSESYDGSQGTGGRWDLYPFFNNTLLPVVQTDNTTSAGSGGRWSPEGDFFAINGSINATTPRLDLYKFDGTTATLLFSKTLTSGTSGTGPGLDWHPTSSFLACAFYTDGTSEGEIQTRTLPRLSTTQSIKVQNGTIKLDRATTLNNAYLRIS